MKRLGLILFLPGWNGSPLQGCKPPALSLPVPIYTGRGTVRVKCLAQQYNTMSLAWARTWTAQSGDKHTNHEATMPPPFRWLNLLYGKKKLFYKL